MIILVLGRTTNVNSERGIICKVIYISYFIKRFLFRIRSTQRAGKQFKLIYISYTDVKMLFAKGTQHT